MGKRKEKQDLNERNRILLTKRKKRITENKRTTMPNIFFLHKLKENNAVLTILSPKYLFLSKIKIN